MIFALVFVVTASITVVSLVAHLPPPHVADLPASWWATRRRRGLS